MEEYLDKESVNTVERLREYFQWRPLSIIKPFHSVNRLLKMSFQHSTIFFMSTWRWKELKFHDGFLSYLLQSRANPARQAVLFGPVLVCSHSVIIRIKFLGNFCNFPHQVDMKIVVTFSCFPRVLNDKSVNIVERLNGCRQLHCNVKQGRIGNKQGNSVMKAVLSCKHYRFPCNRENPVMIA